ncbi:MAG TPA: hypothetical protein VE981_00190 [Planctomycetota bacterium]|nr:hypothetical protein [Planctomycetota bacterium]
MGLDGYVACDCLEKGIAKPPPALAGIVKVDRDTGTTYLDSEDQKLRQIYSRWCASRPCAHENFVRISRPLGNISGIGRIRTYVAGQARDPAVEFPILWRRVLKSGFHSGDAIPVERVRDLQGELMRLRTPASVAPFFERLEELVMASVRTGKPLGF